MNAADKALDRAIDEHVIAHTSLIVVPDPEASDALRALLGNACGIPSVDDLADSPEPMYAYDLDVTILVRPGVGPEMTEARTAAALCRSQHAKDVRIVELTGWTVGRPLADWLAHLPPVLDTPGSVLAWLTSLPPVIDSTPAVNAVTRPKEPASVQTAASWPEPPEGSVYHGIAGEVVRLIEPQTEADPVAVLLQLLIGFGNAVGSGLSILADGHNHHANEFAVIVGATSRARKGTSWRRVRDVLARADPEWSDCRINGGLSSGEGLIYEVRDALPDKDDMGATDKRLLLIESELGNVLRVLAREGNTLSGVLRKAWDGDDLSTLTKNSPVRATNTHISLIGHITSEELTKYLSHVEVFNGLGNRILWACVRRSKRLAFGGAAPGVEAVRLGDRLAAVAQSARDKGAMGWAPAGRTLWEVEYHNLTEDRPGLWGAITSRAEAHVLRLAMIYAALDGSGEIADDHVLAALALWRYCDRSAHYLFRGSVGDRVADTILSALRSSPEGLTRTQIRETIFNRNKSADDIASALGLLLKYNLARREPIETAGRTAERWYAINAVNAESPPRRALSA